jgi:hypothetical protein
LFHSHFKLGHLCRELEEYGATILPNEITANSIKFDIPKAVKFLMQHHGLWGYFESGETVAMAATCDSGELAWKITQVSAGIKHVDT